MQTSKNLLAPLLLIYSAFLLSGCSSTVRLVFDKNKVFKQDPYQSKMPFTMVGGKNNIAGFTDKGQSRLAFDFANGFNSSFSFSPKKNLLFMINYTSENSERGYQSLLKGPFTVYTTTDEITDTAVYQTAISDATHSLKQKCIDVASGYYKKVGKQGSIEFIGGLTYGKADNNYHYEINRANFKTDFDEKRKFIRTYAQTGLCYNSKNVETAVVTKLSVYNFLSQHFAYQYEPQLYSMQRFAVTIEPSAHVGFGRRSWIIYADMGWGIPLYKTDVKWQQSRINLGINWHFSSK